MLLGKFHKSPNCRSIDPQFSGKPNEKKAHVILEISSAKVLDRAQSDMKLNNTMQNTSYP